MSLHTSSATESSGDQSGFLAAAAEYEQLATKASKDGNQETASIYRKLAAIKRDAATSQGDYDWTEYYALKARLSPEKGKQKPKKSENGFINAAKEYEKKAAQAKKSGDTRKAQIYSKMAQIKLKAAVSGDDFNWEEYNQLKEQLEKATLISPKMASLNSQANEHPKHITDDPKGDLIKLAQEHAAQANISSEAGDSYASQIHTRLAAILIDAAAKRDADQSIDWKEYRELKSVLTKHHATE
ncbi:hypothetical protein [Rubritalea squalenifaciens]|nr:hypothetical protein [Rubritalea squalenifaciens]